MQHDNKVKLIVYPSGTGGENLTVADAMQQVLDYFTLLSKAEARDQSNPANVVWRLERATTNSPFTVEATAVSSIPDLPIDAQAYQARIAFNEGITKLLRGEEKPIWFDGDAEDAMRRIIGRNLNGIGRTDVDIGLGEDSLPIILDHRTARRAQNFLDIQAAQEAALVEDLSRKEYGSVEGQAIGLTTHYRKPALVIRERLSGRELKCVLPAASATSIGSQHQWNEVWTNQRIVVSGLCHYDTFGNLTLIDAEDISRLNFRDVSVRDVLDPGFSDGLTPQQHLDKLWGDNHG